VDQRLAVAGWGWYGRVCLLTGSILVLKLERLYDY
jgi:hypothetical protein